MLVALVCGDSPEAWAALGFAVTDGKVRVGTVDVLLDGRGGGIRGWQLARVPNHTRHGVQVVTCRRSSGLSRVTTAGRGATSTTSSC